MSFCWVTMLKQGCVLVLEVKRPSLISLTLYTELRAASCPHTFLRISLPCRCRHHPRWLVVHHLLLRPLLRVFLALMMTNFNQISKKLPNLKILPNFKRLTKCWPNFHCFALEEVRRNWERRTPPRRESEQNLERGEKERRRGGGGGGGPPKKRKIKRENETNLREGEEEEECST